MSEVRSEFMERLAAERGDAEPQVANPEPTEELEYSDPEGGEALEDGVDDAVDTEEEFDPESEAVDGDPEDGEPLEVSQEYKELEDKYKSLEAEFSRITANRKEIEASLEVARTESVRMRQDLESKFEEAEQVANYYADMANQQLQQLSAVNPATLTQEQWGQYQQAFQQAQMQSQQNAYLLEQIRQKRNETLETAKKREAEVARERLKVRIPDWSSEKYNKLGEVAKDYGYSPEEFFETTDHRLMILLNEVAASKEAAKVVQNKVEKTKPKTPKHANARTQERNAKGQYAKAAQTFQNAPPGSKGTFAQMKAAQLKAERERNL